MRWMTSAIFQPNWRLSEGHFGVVIGLQWIWFLYTKCYHPRTNGGLRWHQMQYRWYILTRRFSNHVSRLISRSHTFAIIVILDLKIHQSMWIHWPFFPKTWTKGHWPLDDLWPHVCWGHMCDSTQGSLCPSPMTIHQCMWIQWSILQNTTYIHIHTTYYILHTHTTYRMSDHIVSYWTQFRRDKKRVGPRTEPCGTPDVTGDHLDLVPLTTTHCSRPDRKLWIQVRVFPLMP